MKLAQKILEIATSVKTRRDTTEVKNHYHQYRLTTKESGATTFTIGEYPEHQHKIIDGKVQPAGQDLHTHDLLGESLPFADQSVPNFKTVYGLEHWLTQMQKKNKKKYSSEVVVGGTKYKSPQEAMKLIKRH